MAFTEEENLIFTASISTCSALSICGSMFVIGMYLIFPELRAYSYRLIVYLSVFDLIVSVVLITPRSPDLWCTVKAAAYACACTGRLILTYIIARSIYKSYFNTDYHVESKENPYLLRGAVVLAVLICLPFTTDSYGDATIICWINATGDNYIMGTIWRVVVFYGPSAVITILIIRMYVMVIQDLKTKLNENASESVTEYTIQLMRRLKLFPMFNLVVIIPAFTNRIYDFIYPDEPNFELNLMVTLPISLLGITNATLFAFTPSVKLILLRLIYPKKYRDTLITNSRTSNYRIASNTYISLERI